MLLFFLKVQWSEGRSNRYYSETLAATYAFAAPASAKYLTQFIDADISWVNHVPSHMLSITPHLFSQLLSMAHQNTNT